jgi:hypothetical protein
MTARHLSRPAAARLFLALVQRYGLRWGPDVPAEAYLLSMRVSTVLSPTDKRALLQGRPLDTETPR